ncbi:hypothetical protein EJ08DRAFT_278878 [Tothia fuscella]|uniref:Uncharacterized protein n=1 Tax=Tothia fuscella TaxID=1048955 RepID=A0A9P4NP25_9PEZI|nr:hypothetical protein EJ08DRAFT_278878 [Tothia fuscella]
MKRIEEANRKEKCGISTKRIRYRRGGLSEKGWICCTCGFLNKTGKFYTCQNIHLKLCAYKESLAFEHVWPFGELLRNHGRCWLCVPNGFGEYWPQGQDRYWPVRDMDVMEKENHDRDAQRQFLAADKEFWDKESLAMWKRDHIPEWLKCSRDALTHQKREEGENLGNHLPHSDLIPMS